MENEMGNPGEDGRLYWASNARSLIRENTRPRLAPLCLLLLIIPFVVNAQFTWTTNNGAITITGYTGAGGALTIPDTINGLPVTGIAAYAFSGSFDYSSGRQLTSVSIPTGITSIVAPAFFQCANLTSIQVDPLNTAYSSRDGVLFNRDQTSLLQCPGGKTGSYAVPTGVTNIGLGAFYSCQLTNITFPDSLTTVGGAAFAYSYLLAGITLPPHLTTLGSGAFNDCTRLASITIPDGPGYIGEQTFSYCICLTNVVIPSTITNIGNNAFEECENLGSVTIPDGVTSIGSQAFFDCVSLRSVTIPDSVTTVGDNAFLDCYELENLALGSGVKIIGAGAFGWCEHLTNVTIPDGVITIDGSTFSNCYILENVIFGNSLTNIGFNAFAGCQKLTSVTIPESVTGLGQYAFSGCNGLTQVYFEGNAPAVGESAFSVAPATIYYLPGTTGWSDTFGGRPTAFWELPYPVPLNAGPKWGAQTNEFGFMVSWANHTSTVVEASNSLGNPTWTPVATNTLVNGSATFIDPDWTNHPTSFYRIRSP